MKALTILLCLCLVPAAYANEQLVNTIKDITIQGINLDTDYEQAKAILVKGGYTETLNEKYTYKAEKDGCEISISPRTAHYEHTPKGSDNFVGGIRIRCQKKPRSADKELSADVSADLEKALTALCKTKDNGRNVRISCTGNARAVLDHFYHKETYKDGYTYSAKFKLIKPQVIGLRLAATESKTPPEIK